MHKVHLIFPAKQFVKDNFDIDAFEQKGTLNNSPVNQPRFARNVVLVNLVTQPSVQIRYFFSTVNILHCRGSESIENDTNRHNSNNTQFIHGILR